MGVKHVLGQWRNLGRYPIEKSHILITGNFCLVSNSLTKIRIQMSSDFSLDALRARNILKHFIKFSDLRFRDSHGFMGS